TVLLALGEGYARNPAACRMAGDGVVCKGVRLAAVRRTARFCEPPLNGRGRGEDAMGTKETPDRPSRVRYQVLFAACGVAVISYVHRVGFATASTALKDDFCLSSKDLGYLMTAFLL